MQSTKEMKDLSQLEEFSSWTTQKTENSINCGMMIDLYDLKVN